jgi:hypothetical protein
MARAEWPVAAFPGLPHSGSTYHDGVPAFRSLRLGFAHVSRHSSFSGTMMAAPMLADFAVRLAFGLAIATALVPWRAVPLPFFRTQAQIILGLLALAALDQARASGAGIAFWTIVLGGVLSYVSSIAWGLGLPGLGMRTAVLCGIAALVWLTGASRSPDGLLLAVNATSRAASGFLLGAVLCSMLLGHHYLTAPAMTIDPLKRTIGLIAWGLVARAILAGIGWVILREGLVSQASPAGAADVTVLLAGRWGMGFVAASVATYMTWKAAQIRSTQSATGILYIAVIFVLFGELLSLVLSGRYGVIC